MCRISICFMLFTAFLLGPARSVPTQEKTAEKASTASAPTSGFRAEFLEDVAYYAQRYTRLAEAMLADKYSWRPAEGVRSVGEVYTHIISANYGVASALGTPPPAGFDFKAVAPLSGDKAKVLPVLKESFAHFRAAILALSDADGDKPQKMFNRQRRAIATREIADNPSSTPLAARAFSVWPLNRGPIARFRLSAQGTVVLPRHR